MRVEITNGMLGQVINLLFDLPLKAKQSRHRTKFIKLLNTRLIEVEEQRKELAKEHSNVDDTGEPVMLDDGKKFNIKDMKSFSADLDELYKENLIIDGGDNQETLKVLKEVLDECDAELSGQEAHTYDYLCEQFEGSEK